MRNRAALFAVLTLSVSTGRGLAQTPCDLRPTVGSRVETVQKQGAAFPKPPIGCPPNTKDEGSVCRNPDYTEARTVQTNPRDDCERGLRISIARVKDIDGLPLTNNVITKPGPVKLLVEGDGIANATSAEMGGGIGVTVGAAAQRLGSSPQGTCLPPNCQVVQLDAFPNAPTGSQTLKLFTPHRYASASVDLLVVGAPAPVVAGDVECESPPQSAHARIVLAASRVSGGQSVPGNQVVLSLPATVGKPPVPVWWKLTLHQSFLRSVSPETASGPPAPSNVPVTFSFTAPPAQPAPPPPAAGQYPARQGHEPRPVPTRRCIWARLDWNNGTEIVAAPVGLIP